MNQAIKVKLLDALRSGEYEQGKDCLRQEDLYCCLGVLCDIQGAKWEEAGNDIYAIDEHTEIPPDRFNAGLPMDRIIKLAEMNDDGETFETIADFIEANL